MRTSFLVSRRAFLRRLTASALTAPFVTRGLMAASPNGKLHHASFGASGMAWADLNEIARHPQVSIVAVADVDLNRTGEFKKAFPDAKIYQDWRELLERETALDTVNVSTPDHMHAPIAKSALQRGKHVYGQKPLTHDIYESRRLTEVAREKKVATQMGIQIHSAREYRMAVRLIQDLAIGKVKEVHTWSSKKWGDTGAKPDRTDAVPAGLDWNAWVGVCAERPFIGEGWYHPGNWRKRLDFGTGTFGDMGCHIYDPVFKALALTAPLTVRSEGPAPNAHSWAVDAVIPYVFPGTAYTEGKTVNVTWYDGDARPPRSVLALIEGQPVPDQGSIFIGTDGVLLLPHIGMPVLLPETKFDNFTLPKITGVNHWTQWVDGCLGKGTPSANFDYSGPLTEAVLLGSVATRFPNTTLEWDAKAVKFTNAPAANAHVRKTYRKGWEVAGL